MYIIMAVKNLNSKFVLNINFEYRLCFYKQHSFQLVNKKPQQLVNDEDFLL